MTYEDFLQRYPHDPKKVFKYGGQGVIFKAVDQLTQRAVAIKRAEVVGGMNKYSVLQEFQLGMTLQHPNLATYYDAYRIQTSLGRFDYGIMEFIEDGINLDDFLKTFPDLDQIKEVLSGILDGIEYLHDNRVIHRDLKPNNILIKYEQGQPIPKIIDFGVSKALDKSVKNSSAVVGTVEFMSPEQLGAFAGQIYPNSDLWSFGVIVYKMFLGESPFGSESDGLTREQVMEKIYRAPLKKEELNELIYPYRNIVEGCLIKDPSKRIQTIREIRTLLSRNAEIPEEVSPTASASEITGAVQEELDVLTHKVPAVKAKRKKSRAPLMAVLAVFILTALGFGSWEWYLFNEVNSALIQAEKDFLSYNLPEARARLHEIEEKKYFNNLGNYLLGEIYYQGYEGLEPDYHLAGRYFTKAEESFGEAKLNLGYMYLGGQDFEKDPRQADRLFKSASNMLEHEAKRPTALACLGDMCFNGQGIKEDKARAFDLYQKAADQEFAYAQVQVGKMFLRGQGIEADSTKFFTWVKKGGLQGHPEGEFWTGYAYEFGYGVEKDIVSAQSWYEKASKNGNSNAEVQLGLFAFNGLGNMNKSESEAFGWFKKAALKDNARGQYFLGYMYRYGRGVKKDQKEGFRWYKKSAENNYAIGQNAVGYSYDRGIGVSQNYRKAVYWYRTAANNGNSTGQYNIGFMFENGTGVSTNIDSAYYWYRLADQNGAAGARAALRRLGR